MDKLLKLTIEQREVWTKFVSAMKKCDAYGIGFIINGDGCIYAVNEIDVNCYSFKDDVKDEKDLTYLEELPAVSLPHFNPGSDAFGVTFKSSKQ